MEKNHNLSEKFSNAYTELVKLTENQTINKILKALPFHFLYYCNYRWPMLDRDFKNYLHLFSYKPPKLLIGAHVYHAEWIIPILAAKRCGIDTISIPHGFVQVSYNYNLFLTTKKSLFDYILYVYPLQKEIFKYDSYINETRFIPCKNCTDINSHQVRINYPEFQEKVLKVLILLNPTTKSYPGAKKPLIYPLSRDIKTQMNTILNFSFPPEDLKEKISIKYKVHPNYSELELFNALGEDVLKDLLPTDGELQPVLDQADLVIGVNYIGSALVHALKCEKPYISFINDDFFKKNSGKEKTSILNSLSDSIVTINTYHELWDIVRSFITDPALAEEMKKDVSVFAKEYLDNSSYPTIGCVLEELLKGEKDGR